MSIGTSVDWFPGTGGGSAPAGSAATILHIAEADGDSFAVPELVGKSVEFLSIQTNNQTYTEFGAFPDFAYMPDLGLILGFPVEAFDRIVITYKTI